MNVTVDVSRAVQVVAGIERRVQDLSPAFAGPVDKVVLSYLRRRFLSEGQFGGLRWAPLRPLTRQLRGRPGHGRGGILHDTGRLWASLTKRAGPEAIVTVQPSRYVRGTRVPYARFHHRGWVSRTVFGNPRRRPASVRVPARPLIPDRLPPEIVSTVERVLTRYVATGELGPLAGSSA